MKKFRYKGSAGQVGRFGFVERDTILTLSEEEAYYVRGNPDFEPRRERLDGDFPKEEVDPVKGGHFNLTILSWKTPKVFKEVRRLRKTKLMLILRQMEALGFPVPAVRRSKVDSEYLRDAVLTTARFAGWLP